MDNDHLIENISMICPYCDKVHTIEKRTRLGAALVNDQPVQFNETYFLCRNHKENDNSEFVTAELMDNNLINAKVAYQTLVNSAKP